MNKSVFCKAIHHHEIESLYDPSELLERLSIYSEQNDITVEKTANITVYNPSNSSVPKSDYLATVDNPNADIGIFVNPNEKPSTVRISIIISDNITNAKLGNRVY